MSEFIQNQRLVDDCLEQINRLSKPRWIEIGGVPFKVFTTGIVPPDELWAIGADGQVVKIVGLGGPDPRVAESNVGL